MTKKLIPQEVTKIAVHKNVVNNYTGVPEFTNKNKITDIHKLIDGKDTLDVIDMRNKIVVKCCYIDESLKEDNIYDLLISQNMRDGFTWENDVRTRERLNMRLSKIEIPSGEDSLVVTYVFEKEDRHEITIKMNEVKSQKDDLELKLDDIKKILNLTVEMLKKESASNKN